MRVLQLGPYPPPHGGVQTNLVAIRAFLLKAEHPVRGHQHHAPSQAEARMRSTTQRAQSSSSCF